MSLRIPFNNDWTFVPVYKEEILTPAYDASGDENVRIPHTAAEMPFHYFDESIYQMVCGYRKVFRADMAWKLQRVFAVFEAAAHVAEVYLNGVKIAEHGSGYTAFEAELTEHLSFEEENILVVKCSATEEENVPPFGLVVDYMTYAGIYRPVTLEVRGTDYIEDVFAYGSISERFCYNEADPQKNRTAAELHVKVTTKGSEEKKQVRVSLKRYTNEVLSKELPVPESLRGAFMESTDEKEADSYQKAVALGISQISGTSRELAFKTLPVTLWDSLYPAMYEVLVELLSGNEVIDKKSVRIGFRKAFFQKDGFYLNGRKLKIRGLNRHQSYPYTGYAMPASMQEMDADVLRSELGVNAVRTSHYPQSQKFIDRCDALGLLVFMEFPGWQHIGDDAWKAQAYRNLEEMIVQFRSHPSIMLWGVRINESQDDDAFYKKTNQLAHALDESRQTGGVRAKAKSHLFEDVYTYNDFSHNGKTPGCAPKSKITSDTEKPYMITEYNGHMYPTKSFDTEERRTEHALRHVRVLNQVASYEDIAGSFGWCMFDYNTHKDFGSGDRICYHGVMDMYRNPKLAAAVYESQREEHCVLEVSSNMDIGENSECIRGDVWIITNADAVRVYKNDTFIHEYTASDSPYKNLKHGPILLDDYVGEQIEKNEPYSKRVCQDIKKVMNSAARHGISKMDKGSYVRAGKLVVVNHLGFDEAVRLYNKYIGDWGGKSTTFRFEAVKDGAVVKTVVKAPARQLHLEVKTDHTILHEEETYDAAAIRIRALDQNNNTAPFANEPVSFETEGPITLIGPELTSLNGGMGGCYVKTTGEKGKAVLHIRSNFDETTVCFDIR